MVVFIKKMSILVADENWKPYFASIINRQNSYFFVPRCRHLLFTLSGLVTKNKDCSTKKYISWHCLASKKSLGTYVIVFDVGPLSEGLDSKQTIPGQENPILSYGIHLLEHPQKLHVPKNHAKLEFLSFFTCPTKPGIGTRGEMVPSHSPKSQIQFTYGKALQSK